MEHLLQECKLQLLLQSKLDKKWSYKKLINLFFNVVGELARLITGKAFHNLEILGICMGKVARCNMNKFFAPRSGRCFDKRNSYNVKY